MARIDITGISKPALLAALCNATRPMGYGVLEANEVGEVTEEMARRALVKGSHIDYCFGRPIKIDFSGNDIDPWGYDRDAGKGAAERVVNVLRAG